MSKKAKQSAKVTKDQKKGTDKIKSGKAGLVVETPTLDLSTKGNKPAKLAKAGKASKSQGEAPEMVEDATTNQIQDVTGPLEEAPVRDVDRAHADFLTPGMTDEVHLILQNARAAGFNVSASGTGFNVSDDPQPEATPETEAPPAEKLSKKERKAAEKLAAAQSKAAIDATLHLTGSDEAPVEAAPVEASAPRTRTTQLQRELQGAVTQANKRKEPFEIVLDRKYTTRLNGARMAKELLADGVPATWAEEFYPEGPKGYWIVTITIHPKKTVIVDNQAV